MKSEKELASYIITYYENLGYEIYKEVYNIHKGNRADIIAIKNDEYIVIETKMSFGLTIIEQAFKWKENSHKTYICLPSTKRNSRYFGYNICSDYGIGIIEVSKSGNVRILKDSFKNHSPILPQIYEQQKDQIAGSKPTKDSYITPFKITVNLFKQYLEDKNELVKLTDVIKDINHHYSSDTSAKTSLMKMIKIGVIEDVELIKEKSIVYVKLR